MSRIVVVDYGMGNLRSVSKALESLGASVCVSSDPREVAAAEKLILPGVGAFGAAMQELTRRSLVESITSVVGRGAPYLGICLGLQLLFDESEENRGVSGLKILGGMVRRFQPPESESVGVGLKVPHMGWNQVARRQPPASSPRDGCPLLKGIDEGSFVYFVHSYYVDPTDPSVVALEADYGVRFTAMVWRDNLYATQFHPEKSQAVGLRILENFIRL